MTKQELGIILNKMYSEAKKGEKVTIIHLFGIKYGNIIRENNYSFKEIAQNANISETYVTELTKGANLAKYVKEK
jgi:AraC-like DNA-binding protein